MKRRPPRPAWWIAAGVALILALAAYAARSLTLVPCEVVTVGSGEDADVYWTFGPIAESGNTLEFTDTLGFHHRITGLNLRVTDASCPVRKP